MPPTAPETPEPTPSLLRGALHERHVALGAKLAEFGGWEMPLEYPTGVLREHAAVRVAVGVFDVSHLGKLRVRGEGAVDFLNACLSNDLRRTAPGQAQYTLACDASGGVVDDLIAYHVADDEVLLVPNAANTAEVRRRLEQALDEQGRSLDIKDQHRSHAVLAVQGPRSAELLGGVGLPSGHDYMSFQVASYDGHDVVVCRTGYTGEHGYELIVDNAAAPALWDALLAAGEPLGGLPAGLGARDTLRTEMGYPLHGQDISLDVTPVQARTGWAVGWKKDAFWGRDALLQEKEAGPARVLRGLESRGRGIARPGMAVRTSEDAGGQPVGTVTSGTFSPTLRRGIALALIDASVAEGDEVVVEVRQRAEPFTVTRPPFVESHIR